MVPGTETRGAGGWGPGRLQRALGLLTWEGGREGCPIPAVSPSQEALVSSRQPRARNTLPSGAHEGSWSTSLRDL